MQRFFFDFFHNDERFADLVGSCFENLEEAKTEAILFLQETVKDHHFSGINTIFRSTILDGENRTVYTVEVEIRVIPIQTVRI